MNELSTINKKRIMALLVSALMLTGTSGLLAAEDEDIDLTVSIAAFIR